METNKIYSKTEKADEDLVDKYKENKKFKLTTFVVMSFVLLPVFYFSINTSVIPEYVDRFLYGDAVLFTGLILFFVNPWLNISYLIISLLYARYFIKKWKSLDEFSKKIAFIQITISLAALLFLPFMLYLQLYYLKQPLQLQF